MGELIELETLLHGEPSWEEVVEFFKQGEFFEIHYKTQAIAKHLLTPEHKLIIYESEQYLSIESIITGNCDYTEEVIRIIKDWNDKLGFQFMSF